MLNLHRKRLRGVTLIELMVGITVGLVVITGALTLFASSLNATRRLAAETRVEQELRTIADLITRDLRRASYWAEAEKGTMALSKSSSATTANAYATVTPTVSSTNGKVEYAFSRDAAENNTVDNNESFGFQRTADGELQMQTAAGNWQTLNDTNYVRINSVSLTDSSPNAIPLGHRCVITCSAGSAGCPEMQVRRYDLVITGQSAVDANVTRTLRTSVRLRNDTVTGSCP